MADETFQINQMNYTAKKLNKVLDECIIIDTEKLRKYDKKELEQILARYNEFKDQPGFNQDLPYKIKKLIQYGFTK